VLALSQKYNLPEFICRILTNKNITIDNVEHYLSPKLKNLLPDPFILSDMNKAVMRITQAIFNNETIAIFGDYDVDGATSSALLKRFFDLISINSLVYIPDRIKEGYGPNNKAFDYIKSEGIKLVITVDCGTLSFEPLKYAKEIGLDVIVVDHHISDTNLPEAAAIINPNKLGEKTELHYLAAVGVCFLLIAAINIRLKEQNFYSSHTPEPNLMRLLDLVALGTVCDVVPMIGLNRAFVVQGLKILSSRSNIGLSVLSDLAGIKEIHSTYHLGYVLGPRINASGRVGESYLGTRLLSTNDSSEAEDIATRLESYNAERKTIESQVMEEVITRVEGMDKETPLLMITGYNWHQGVIGIIASRLKESYNKPVAVISIENGKGKASCRSIRGINFGSAIIKAKLAGIVKEGGGHSMAAGFTVEENRIEDLKNFINQEFERQLKNNVELDIDYFISHVGINGLTVEVIQRIESIGPFGAGNSEPKFMLQDVRITKAYHFGESHVSCFIADLYSKKIIKACAFRAKENELSDVIVNNIGNKVAIIGSPKINRWQGNQNIEFIIDDIII
jgi:single-stranded-DNA-specific exonuclease